jgi:protein TonB
MSRHKPPRSAPPEKKESDIWWHRLSTGEKLSSVFGLLTVIAASLVVPEVRNLLGLEKEGHMEIPAPSLPKPPAMTQGQPSVPRYQVVPLVNAPEPKKEQIFTYNNKSGSPLPSNPQSQGKPTSYSTKDLGPPYDEHPSSDSPVAFGKKWSRDTLTVSETLASAHLIHRVEPSVPLLARQARLQGSVVLQVMIGTDGKVQSTKVISGHPILAQAARDAVMQWRYDPFRREGEPEITTTTVTVEFPPGKNDSPTPN